MDNHIHIPASKSRLEGLAGRYSGCSVATRNKSRIHYCYAFSDMKLAPQRIGSWSPLAPLGSPSVSAFHAAAHLTNLQKSPPFRPPQASGGQTHLGREGLPKGEAEQAATRFLRTQGHCQSGFRLACPSGAACS
jgi:hypothetical protein